MWYTKIFVWISTLRIWLLFLGVFNILRRKTRKCIFLLTKISRFRSYNELHCNCNYRVTLWTVITTYCVTGYIRNGYHNHSWMVMVTISNITMNSGSGYITNGYGNHSGMVMVTVFLMVEHFQLYRNGYYNHISMRLP